MKGETAPSLETVSDGRHLLAEFDHDPYGPTLVVVGGIHGNEAAGVKALLNVRGQLEPLRDHLDGRVYFLAGNTRALRRGTRFIDADLNRHWTSDNVSGAAHTKSEDAELSELLAHLEKILSTARDEVYVLDLHTTSAAGYSFATLGDTLRNRHFARKFPITILLGIEEQLRGTLLEYINNRGAVTLGYEGGQHYASSSVSNHEALVWLSLLNTRILAARYIPALKTHRETLRTSAASMRVLEVRYRKAIKEGDDFEMRPGFKNFDPISKGEVLATDRSGSVSAVEGGLILMPLYQKQGEDGFFIGRKVVLFWIWISEVLRLFRVAELMPYLPGVSVDSEDPESLIVDTGTARFFPLQVFHLLGFRRRRWSGKKLIVSRRRFDTRSPFKTRKNDYG